MRITNKRDNREYTYSDFGRPEYYEEMVDNMCARLKINRSIVGEIEKVYVGSSDYPTNEIYMSSGVMLYDENTCTIWTADENKKTLRKAGLVK